MSTGITEYSKTEAALTDLGARYKGVVFDVTGKSGMEEAKKGRAEIRGYRANLERIRKEIKAPALLKCQQIDTEAKRISSALESLESPIDDQIKKEELRKEEEKNAAIRIAQERMETEVRALKEAEEKKMADERAEIALKQAELAEREKAMQDKIEAEERAARLRIEEADRAARLAREEADRVLRIAREAEEAKDRKARQEEQDKLRAEHERLRVQQLKIDEKKRKEREAEEAKQRAFNKILSERADAIEMLRIFTARHENKEEFTGILNAIKKYFEANP